MKRSGTTANPQSGWEKVKTVSAKINHIIDLVGMWLFRLRKFILAAPVLYYAVKLYAYNAEHLPELVGLGLQATGEYSITVARSLALMGPFALTVGCLVLMFFSRKAMYSWAISIFSLALPILVLVSNVYPA